MLNKGGYFVLFISFNSHLTYKRPINSTAPQKRSTSKDRRHGDCALLSRTWPDGETQRWVRQQGSVMLFTLQDGNTCIIIMSVPANR